MIDPVLLLIEYIKEELKKEDIKDLFTIAKEAKLIGEPSMKALMDLAEIWEAYLLGERSAAEEIMNKYGIEVLSVLDKLSSVIRESEKNIIQGKIRLANKLKETGREMDASAIALEVLRDLVKEIDGITHSPIDVARAIEKTIPETKNDVAKFLQYYTEEKCPPLTYCYPQTKQVPDPSTIIKLNEVLLGHKSSELLKDKLYDTERTRLKNIVSEKFSTDAISIILTIDDLIRFLSSKEETEIIVINDESHDLKELAHEISQVFTATVVNLSNILNTENSSTEPNICSEIGAIYLSLIELAKYINIGILPEIGISSNGVEIKCCGREIKIEDITNNIGKENICNVWRTKEKKIALGFRILSILFSRPSKQEGQATNA